MDFILINALIQNFNVRMRKFGRIARTHESSGLFLMQSITGCFVARRIRSIKDRNNTMRLRHRISDALILYSNHQRTGSITTIVEPSDMSVGHTEPPMGG